MDADEEEAATKAKVGGTGNFEDYSHLRPAATQPLDYSLLIRHRDNSLLTTFSFNVSSVISVINNKTGEKVFSVAGRGVGLVKEFEEALRLASL